MACRLCTRAEKICMVHHLPGIIVLEGHHRRRTVPTKVNRFSRGAGVECDSFALERYIQNINHMSARGGGRGER